MKMPNATEAIEMLAREAEDRKILAILKECKDLDEAIQKVQALITK